MTKWGQTNGFKASDFARELQAYLAPAKLDMVIVNTQKPGTAVIARYQKEKAEFVEPDLDVLKTMGTAAAGAELVFAGTFEKNSADTLTRSMLRHDSDKLAKLIVEAV